jgi:hypothetical protein
MEVNIRIDLSEIQWKAVDWILLVKGSEPVAGSCEQVMNFQFHKR